MKLRTMSVVSSLAIMASMAAPAYAQDDEADTSGRTNEIVVTAAMAAPLIALNMAVTMNLWL